MRKEEYVEYFKDSLTQAVPGINFSGEYVKIFVGKDVLFLEFDLTQRGVSFKVISALVSGNNNDIWIISFNTTKDNINTYQGLFEEIVASFNIK